MAINPKSAGPSRRAMMTYTSSDPNCTPHVRIAAQNTPPAAISFSPRWGIPLLPVGTAERGRWKRGDQPGSWGVLRARPNMPAKLRAVNEKGEAAFRPATFVAIQPDTRPARLPVVAAARSLACRNPQAMPTGSRGFSYARFLPASSGGTMPRKKWAAPLIGVIAAACGDAVGIRTANDVTVSPQTVGIAAVGGVQVTRVRVVVGAVKLETAGVDGTVDFLSEQSFVVEAALSGGQATVPVTLGA